MAKEILKTALGVCAGLVIWEYVKPVITGKQA